MRPLALSLRRTSRPGGRVGPGNRCAEESPGSTGLGWLLTATRGDPRESATESRPPATWPVRVKRRCKRPPAFRVTGTARQTPPGARSRRIAWETRGFAQAIEGGPPEPAGRPLEPLGDERPRWMAVARCVSAGHRTRLTGRLVRRLSSSTSAVHELATSSCACSEHGRSCFQHATHDTMRLDVQRCVGTSRMCLFYRGFLW